MDLGLYYPWVFLVYSPPPPPPPHTHTHSHTHTHTHDNNCQLDTMIHSILAVCLTQSVVYCATQELGRLVILLGLSEPMERMFRRAVELLRENAGRVAAPVMKGNPARITMLLESAWAHLSDHEKLAASTVGYTEEMWATFGSLGGSGMCRPTTQRWNELSQSEKVRSVSGPCIHACLRLSLSLCC